MDARRPGWGLDRLARRFDGVRLRAAQAARHPDLTEARALYSEGVERALRTAIAAHEGQLRKGGDAVPYVVHPVHVAIVLARWGMNEHVIQAGVLHDVVEDCDGWTLERVADEFGAEVAAIVADVTEDKSRTWEERKQAGIEHVEHMCYEAAAVKAADKLHNLRSLAATLREASEPGDVWRRFRGGRERTLATAAELVRALERRLDERMTRPLRAVLAELSELG